MGVAAITTHPDSGTSSRSRSRISAAEGVKKEEAMPKTKN